MPHTIESALSHPAIEMPRKFLSEFRFTLKDIATEIVIRTYEPLEGRGVWFEQSHFIKTPLESSPYQTSRPWNDYEAAALNQVVKGITDSYDAAIKNGHEPSDDWLIPNKHF